MLFKQVCLESGIDCADFGNKSRRNALITPMGQVGVPYRVSMLIIGKCIVLAVWVCIWLVLFVSLGFDIFQGIKAKCHILSMMVHVSIKSELLRDVLLVAGLVAP